MQNAYYIFFFFQAEDGIRDLTVTGVQTCALPISDVEGLTVWLESVLATASRITPTPTEIVRRLGATSPAHDLDRKSTRLNSSHSQISYAVFCLKKKKK